MIISLSLLTCGMDFGVANKTPAKQYLITLSQACLMFQSRVYKPRQVSGLMDWAFMHIQLTGCEEE
jgi:hypothetical protein